MTSMLFSAVLTVRGRQGGPAVLLCMLLLIPALSLAGSSPAGKVERPFHETEGARPGDCLTEAEAELGRLVNRLREEHQLLPVPIVKPLYRVAKWHVIDLSVNAPHKGRNDDRGMACNLHSWSGTGRETGGGWEPLCYTSDHKQALGMWSKPREISGHRSNGYENVYWTSAPLSPAMAINYWQGRDSELDMILGRRTWQRHVWRSMGVGVFGNFAAVWLSEKSASDSEMSLCGQAGN